MSHDPETGEIHDDIQPSYPAPMTAPPIVTILSPTFGKLALAVAKAQGAFANPEKNRTVTVRPKDATKQPYTFSYATLDSTLDAIRKPLSDNELAIFQIPTTEADGSMVLITRLIHSSSEWLESKVYIHIEGQGIQQLGSALTYLRRYMVSSILGIAPEEDDDGNATDGNIVTGAQGKGKDAPGRAQPPTPAPQAQKPPPEANRAPQATPTQPAAGQAAPAATDPGVVWMNRRLDELGLCKTKGDFASWDKMVAQLNPNLDKFKERYPALHEDLMRVRKESERAIS